MTYVDTYLSQLIVALSISVALLFGLAPVARKAGLVAEPDERKTHERVVPLIGGLCIAISFFLSILLFDISLSEFRILFFSSGILLLVGLLDDYKDISPVQKFILQMFSAVILIVMGNVEIDNIGDIVSSGQPVTLGIFAPIFSLIAILGVVNAFNMIDGHDGVAASVSLIALVTIAFLYYLDPGVSNVGFVVLLLLLIVTTIPFLFFNLAEVVGPGRQVFLGDAGSMFLGFIICYFLIQFSQGADNAMRPVFSPAVAPWVIGIPLLDMTAVIILRIIRRRGISRADREHLHYLLADLGLSRYGVLLTIALLQVICSGVAIVATVAKWSDQTTISLAALVSIFYFFLRIFLDNKVR